MNATNGIKHILVPTDFSEPSERAMKLAIEIAQTFDARITLLHVWSIPNVGYAEALSWPIDAMEREARKALENARVSVVKQHVATDALLREGKTFFLIIDAVKELDVDLIVIGTHGRRGLPRLVLGSVAEKVVRASPVPVLTVAPMQRPSGYERVSAS
jgi:nucleotide-binding universal stress UspA family protein